MLLFILTTLFAAHCGTIWGDQMDVLDVPTLQFTPEDVEVVEKEKSDIFGVGQTSGEEIYQIYIECKDTELASIFGNASVETEYVGCPNGSATGLRCFNFSFTVEGVFLGRTELTFSAVREGDEPPERLPVTYRVAVLRQYSVLSDIFMYVIIIMVSINTIGFGCTIDLTEMRRIVRKPVAPCIGLACQFIINPLVTYGLGVAYGLTPALALGLFSLGCCPGGGASNMWSFLLGGDLDLSIIMTLGSTIACFGMLPLWMYTLGATLIPEDVSIPFLNIFLSLLSLVLPCTIGILINRFAPKAAKMIRKLIRPFIIFLLIFIFSVGVYSNLYMFTLMNNWRVLVSGFSVPYSSYLISALVAWVLRQSPARILTISIETAIQNTGIAVVLILTTFPKPDADIAAVMPVICVMFTPLPLAAMLIVKTIYQKCCKSKTAYLEKEKSVDVNETPEIKKEALEKIGDEKETLAIGDYPIVVEAPTFKATSV